MIRANMPKIIMTVMVIVWLMRITMVFAINWKSRVAPIQLPATMMRLPLTMMVRARLQDHKDCDGNCLNDADGDGVCDEWKSRVVSCNRIQSTIMQRQRIDGSCTCDTRYAGVNCDECDTGYAVSNVMNVRCWLWWRWNRVCECADPNYNAEQWNSYQLLVRRAHVRWARDTTGYPHQPTCSVCWRHVQC